MALKIAGVGIVVGFLLMVGLFAYFRKDLPNITDVNGNSMPGSISYYDKTGQQLLWQDYDAVKRIPVSADNINENIKNATIAIEDKDFYKEGAFNVRGIARAAFNDVFGGGDNLQGGSTITQQLVKLNENWTNDRTISRKIKEVILAVEMEREYSKKDILAGYLNAAPYGGIEVGVESAARDYFGTTAKDLTLAQASLLAAIPQSPAYYSPYSDSYDKEALIGRQEYILDRMVEQGLVTKDEADKAKTQTNDVLANVKPLQPKYQGIQAPYFVLAAKDELEQTYLGKTTTLGGWKVDTTLDMKLQKLAEDEVTNGIKQVKRQGGDDAAFVAEDVKTGEIVAAVGGVDFNNEEYGKLNFAHSVKVSPGSTFKPYDYTALIDKSTNVGAGSVLYDQQGALPGYPCTNKQLPKNGGNCLWDYDFQYPGAITLRYALGGSRNVPAVKAMLTVGTDKVIKMANDLMAKDDAYVCYKPGTDVFSATKKDESACYGSSAIGDGAYITLDDHVNGLASLARLGSAMRKTYIHKITDANGKEIELQKRPTKQVVRPDAAYILDDMASDPKASYLPSSYICGPGGPCKFHDYKGWKFAIKTGTTNDGYDGLMASWSTQYAALTWVGYHTRTKAMTGNMETMTAPIVRGWMYGAHDALNTKPVNWTAPTGVKTAPSFVVTKHIGVGSVEPSPTNDIYPSWYQPKTGNNQATTIDKVSNKLATSCTPDAAKKTIYNTNSSSFSVDQFVNGGTAAAYNTTAQDDVHNCSDAKPTVDLTVSSNSSGSQTDICDLSGCTITATVSQGSHPLTSGNFPGQVSVSINGTVVKSFTIGDVDSPQTFSFQYTPTSSGAASVTASVTDSVLYSGSASGNVTLQNSGDDSNANGNTNTTGGTRRRGQ